MRTMAPAVLAVTLAGLALAPGPLAAAPSSQGEAPAHLRHLFTVPASIPGSQLGGSREIEIGPDNTVYVADPEHLRVCAYKLDKTLRFCFGASGPAPGLLDGVDAMLVTPDGDILVQDTDVVERDGPEGRTNRIKRYSAEGDFEEELRVPLDLEAVGADGSLYGWDFRGRLVRLSANGGLSAWGPGGPQDPAAFSTGSTVAVDTRGHAFVADLTDGKVRHYDAAGKLVATWDGVGDPPGQLGMRLIARMGTDGHLLVLSRSIEPGSGYAVQRYTLDGQLTSSFRPAAHATDGGNGPSFQDAAMAAGGSILVATGGNAILQRFSPEGRRLAVWENNGSASTWRLPYYPSALLGNPDGSVRIFDRFGSWTDVSAAGDIVGEGQLPLPTDRENALSSADAISRRPDGGVCTVGLEEAWCFDAAGAMNASWRWDDGGWRPNYLASIEISAGGAVWITDPNDALIYRFDGQGTKLGELRLPIPEGRLVVGERISDDEPGTLRLPIAFAPDGSAWIVEQCPREVRDRPEPAPSIHHVSAAGEYLGAIEVGRLFGLDPIVGDAMIHDFLILPSGRALATAQVVPAADPASPREGIWVLDLAGGPAVALDTGRDGQGRVIRPNRLALAGPDRLWTTRRDRSGNGLGDLDAFAVEAAPPTAEPRRLSLPWLER